MKTLKQGEKILNIDNNNKEVTILNRDINYCFLQCKDSSGRIYYNVGNVWIDREKEVLTPGMITDEDHYKRSQEDVYNNWYLVGIADRDRKAEAKARSQAEAKQKEDKEQAFNKCLTEAKALQTASLERLGAMMRESGNMEKLMKDKEAKNHMETISFVDAIFYHRQALNW